MGKGHEGGAIQYPYGDASIEQSQLTSNGAWYGFTTADHIPIAQTFTPEINCHLESFAYFVGHWEAPVIGTITCTLQTTNLEGKPSGTILATKVIDASTIPLFGGDDWVTITFDSTIALTAGVKYAVVQVCSENWTSTFASWAIISVCDEIDYYTRGKLWWYDADTWVSTHGGTTGTYVDLKFKIIINPPGLQKYAKTEIILANDLTTVQIKAILPDTRVYLSDPIGMTLQP